MYLQDEIEAGCVCVSVGGDRRQRSNRCSVQTTTWGPGHVVLRAESFSRADPVGSCGPSPCFTVPFEEWESLKTSPTLMLCGGVGIWSVPPDLSICAS